MKIEKFPYVEGCNEDTGCDGCLHLNEKNLDCKLDQPISTDIDEALAHFDEIPLLWRVDFATDLSTIKKHIIFLENAREIAISNMIDMRKTVKDRDKRIEVLEYITRTEYKQALNKLNELETANEKFTSSLRAIEEVYKQFPKEEFTSPQSRALRISKEIKDILRGSNFDLQNANGGDDSEFNS